MPETTRKTSNIFVSSTLHTARHNPNWIGDGCPLLICTTMIILRGYVSPADLKQTKQNKKRERDAKQKKCAPPTQRQTKQRELLCAQMQGKRRRTEQRQTSTHSTTKGLQPASRRGRVNQSSLGAPWNRTDHRRRSSSTNSLHPPSPPAPSKGCVVNGQMTKASIK